MNKWIYNNDPDIAFPYECPYCGCGHSFPLVACDRCKKIVNPLAVEESPAETEIAGIAMERWKWAFGQAVNLAIDKDYFSDILEYDLFANDDEIDYEKAWDAVNEAFEAIFGFKRY